MADCADVTCVRGHSAQHMTLRCRSLAVFFTVAQSCQTHYQKYQQQLTWKEQQLRVCRRDRFKSVSTPRDEWRERIDSQISRQTVNRRLLSRRLRARRPAKEPLLTHQRKRNRLEWAPADSNVGNCVIGVMYLFLTYHVPFYIAMMAKPDLGGNVVCGQRFLEDTVMP